MKVQSLIKILGALSTISKGFTLKPSYQQTTKRTSEQNWWDWWIPKTADDTQILDTERHDDANDQAQLTQVNSGELGVLEDAIGVF